MDFIFYLQKKLRVCSTNVKDLLGEVFESVASYTRSLIKFYTSYTKKPYLLEKLGNLKKIKLFLRVKFFKYRK
jgi:hypothetical protein